MRQFLFSQYPMNGSYFMHVLQMRKLKLRHEEWLDQGHTAPKLCLLKQHTFIISHSFWGPGIREHLAGWFWLRTTLGCRGECDLIQRSCWAGGSTSKFTQWLLAGGLRSLPVCLSIGCSSCLLASPSERGSEGARARARQGGGTLMSSIT